MKRWKVALSLAVIAAIAVPALAGTWRLAPGRFATEAEKRRDEAFATEAEKSTNRYARVPRMVLDMRMQDAMTRGGNWGDIWYPAEEITSEYVAKNLTVAASAFGLTFALVMVTPPLARRYWQWLRR
jgi:hypothetical protein